MTDIQYYSSIKEMPANRYTELQKMIAYDCHVGSNFSDAIKHLEKLLMFVGKVDNEEVVKEATNLHNNYFFLISGLNFQSMTLACMVKTIDGEEVTITDEESIKDISRRIGEAISQQEVEEKIDEVKKNSEESFESTSLKTIMMLKSQILSRISDNYLS